MLILQLQIFILQIVSDIPSINNTDHVVSVNVNYCCTCVSDNVERSGDGRW